MKIALTAHCLHPIKEPFEGGLDMMTFLLCKSLMERGHEVHLYAHRHGSGHCNYARLFSKVFGDTMTVFTDRKYRYDASVDVIGLLNEDTRFPCGSVRRKQHTQPDSKKLRYEKI